MANPNKWLTKRQTSAEEQHPPTPLLDSAPARLIKIYHLLLEMRLKGIEIRNCPHSYFVQKSFLYDLHPQKNSCGPKGGLTQRSRLKNNFTYIQGAFLKKTQKFNFPLKMINNG